MKNFNLLSILGLGTLLGFVACATPSTPSESSPPPKPVPPQASPPSSSPASPLQQPPAGNASGMEGGPGNGPSADSDSGEEAIEEPAYAPAKRAMTTQERVSALEEKLGKKLIEFDGLLLDERLTVKTEHKEKAADDFHEAERLYGRAGVAGDSKTGDSPPPLPPRAGDEVGATSGGGSMPPPEERQGDYDHASAAASIPPDIPRDSQEDVVARQLREAALEETDPEQRQKLWNEYRRYKGLPVKK